MRCPLTLTTPSWISGRGLKLPTTVRHRGLHPDRPRIQRPPKIQTWTLVADYTRPEAIEPQASETIPTTTPSRSCPVGITNLLPRPFSLRCRHRRRCVPYHDPPTCCLYEAAARGAARRQRRPSPQMAGPPFLGCSMCSRRRQCSAAGAGTPRRCGEVQTYACLHVLRGCGARMFGQGGQHAEVANWC